MKQNTSNQKHVRVEQQAYEKLFILAHHNLMSLTKYLTRLIEAEWTTYQIETNGGHDDKSNSSNQ